MRDLTIGETYVVVSYEGNKGHSQVGSVIRITHISTARSPSWGQEYRCKVVRSSKRGLYVGEEWYMYAEELRPLCMFHGGEHEHS